MYTVGMPYVTYSLIEDIEKTVYTFNLLLLPFSYGNLMVVDQYLYCSLANIFVVQRVTVSMDVDPNHTTNKQKTMMMMVDFQWRENSSHSQHHKV